MNRLWWGGEQVIMATRATFVARLVMALGAALAVSACEGDNLFDDDVFLGGVEVIVLTVPDTAIAPVTINIEVQARARAGMDQIVVQYGGVVTDEERIMFNGQTNVVTAGSSVEIDASPIGALLIVRARAIDLNGRSSEAAVDTVRIIS